MKKRCIAIIPARAFSKRIKNKSIKNFFGKPIISYAIKTAKKSKLFDDVYVSTDSLLIKRISNKYGAKVPFIRPKNLSGDFTSVIDVISHAVKKICTNYKDIYGVCCIFPATPLLKHTDLIKSFKIFERRNSEYLFSAIKFTNSPERSFNLSKKNSLIIKNKNLFAKNKRTQDYKEHYHDGGQFYWAKPKTWLNKKKVFTNRSSVYLQENNKFVDIDTMDDWKRAEFFFRMGKKIN
tara:strand:- start:2784 stop:3491 length:708 start_codon:yes stop_codon:yes gene_type:complete